MSIPVLENTYGDSRERLEKVTKATAKRNAERPELPWTAFDRTQVPRDIEKSLLFLLTQMYYTEASSADNLASLVKNTKNASLRAVYAAQIQDEVVHGRLLYRYLHECWGKQPQELQPHAFSVVAQQSALAIQRDPVAGVVAITMGIEFFTSAMLKAIEEKNAITEPVLQSMLQQIRQDEERHRVIAVESAVLLEKSHFLEEARWAQKLALWRCGKTLDVVAFFYRHIATPLLQKTCSDFGVSFRQIYEQSLVDIQHALQKEGSTLVAAAIPVA